MSSIERAAVIGAGVMGSGLAAHLANAGIPTLLLDIVPPDGSGVPGDPASANYRNAFAARGLQTALKIKPAAFFVKEGARLVQTGNLDDDLELLRDVDWVLEAVVERLDIKQQLFEKIAPFLKPGALLSTNTSGLSIEEMAAVMPADLQPRFAGTHFFNPPRYLRLVEVIPHSGTDPRVASALAAVCQETLGKGIVHAKDTPNFIANRVGVYSIMAVIRTMLDDGYTIEEIDALTGSVMGRPKSATFRTADVVGLDTFVHAANTVYQRATNDEQREVIKPPALIERLVAENRLGQKTGEGFYKKVKQDGKSVILTLDTDTFDYREAQRPKLGSLDMAKAMEGGALARIGALVGAKDRGGQFVWKTLSDTMVYAANRLGEIADDVLNIDRAMRWGFGWQHGPFELWDALGVEKVVKRLESEGREVPEAARKVLSTSQQSFYHRDDNFKTFYFASGEHREQEEPLGTIDLKLLKARGAVVKKNAGASLVDMGDGVLGLEFHSKMNSIGSDIISMVFAGIKETEANFDAMVVGNHGRNFSVGANLMLLLLEAQDGNYEEIDLMVRQFQKATMALKYCKRPVVAAPFGMTLGGGCEIMLGCPNVFASAETYTGLVEVGVGLIPAGGGCKELLIRNLEGMPRVDGIDLFPAVRAAFETIGLAKVSTSAVEAKQMRLLRHSDGVAMNPDRLLFSAKAMALGLATQGYRRPDPTIQIPVVGRTGIGAIKTNLYNMREGGFISEYDQYIGGELARILCGGELASGTLVDEQYLLDLEREVFLRLVGQRKTLERMQFMLKKGKPLRN